MTGKFFLRTDTTPNERGEQYVYIQYCTQGVACKKKTDIKVKPEHWLGDNGDGKFIKGGRDGNPNAQRFNQTLLNIRKGYDNVIDGLLDGRNKVIPAPVMRSILNGSYEERIEENNGKVDFVQFALDYNEQLYKLGKVGYSIWENVRSYMRKFSEYLKEVRHLNTTPHNVLYCRDINVDIIRGYILWRKGHGNTNDTINKSLTPIFKACKQSYRKQWISAETYDEITESYLPANGNGLGEGKMLEFLSIEQLKALKKAAAEAKYDRTRDFVDMFMFSLFCGGLRVSDIVSLRWSEVNMEERMVSHYQVKNHNRKSVLLQIPMADGAIEILNRWKGRNENFVFGLLDDEFDLNDEERFYHVKQSRDRTINQSLHVLGEKIGLPFKLHMHCSRHSFGTNGLNNGGDVKTISSLMGHSSVLTTEKVYASVLPETKKKELDRSLNFQI
jgi:integrase